MATQAERINSIFGEAPDIFAADCKKLCSERFTNYASSDIVFTYKCASRREGRVNVGIRQASQGQCEPGAYRRVECLPQTWRPKPAQVTMRNERSGVRADLSRPSRAIILAGSPRYHRAGHRMPYWYSVLYREGNARNLCVCVSSVGGTASQQS